MKLEGHYSWGLVLEDCPDVFERVLGLLPPADVAACRLVSHTWRREVSRLLECLQPAAGTQPAAAAAAFPNLVELQLTAGSNNYVHDSGGSISSSLPPLDALPAFRHLRRLRLRGLKLAGSALDCRSLVPLGRPPCRLEDLEASCLELQHAAALQQLCQLSRLHLAGYSLGGWAGSLPALLLPLPRLSHLHYSSFHEAGSSSSGSSAAAMQGAGAAAGSGGGASTEPAGLLAGISQLTALTCLELSCRDAASNATCREAAALPRLARLAITRCSRFGRGAPSISDGGLAALRQLSSQLSSLSLVGHTAISNDGLAHLGRLTCLQHLELCFGTRVPEWPWHPEVTDAGSAELAALPSLRSLHLGGSCQIGEAACAAIAARLTGLTSLRFSDCASLADGALFKLAPLAPALRQLALCSCGGITDIALVAVLKDASRLSELDLSGCHRNITGVGLCSLRHLRRLTKLNLAGCEAITDTEIESLLAAARSLQHLDLRDCRVTDRACALLAAYAPQLQWLSLEHCPGVSDKGFCCLAAALPHLQELCLFGSSVSPEAVAQERATERGRRLRVGMHKDCWWLQAAARL